MMNRARGATLLACLSLVLGLAVLGYGLVQWQGARDDERRADRSELGTRRALARTEQAQRRAEADLAAASVAVEDFASAAQGAVDAGARLVDLEGQLADRLSRLRAAGATEDIGAYNRIVDELNGSTATINAAIDALRVPFEGFGRALGRLPTARCAGPRTEPITWEAYGTSGLQCARLAVPLDYDHPKRATIELTIVRRPADDPTVATPLVINPGGPGGSGIAALRAAGLELPPEVLRRFDLIGVDPRGVGQSTPVDCADRLDALFDIDLTNENLDVRSTQLDRIQKIVRQCRARSGELLEHVDTQSAARDLDRVRQALGVDQISYLGYSYGTYLGAVYADRFPERIRAAVLDGAVGPDYAGSELTLDSESGFVELLDDALVDCSNNPGCSFRVPGDPDTTYDDLMTRLQTEPIKIGDRRLGRGLAELGVATILYEGRDGWPDLMDALTTAYYGDGTALLALSDSYTGRRRDGSYSNEVEAHAAISCIEVGRRPTRADARAKVRGISQEPARFEVVDVMLSLPCTFWPAPPVTPRRNLDARGAAPILVVGTNGDPVTPIEGAELLADALDSGQLLRWEGDAHTAFGRGNDCIDTAVTRYLVDLTLPPDGTSCPAE